MQIKAKTQELPVKRNHAILIRTYDGVISVVVLCTHLMSDSRRPKKAERTTGLIVIQLHQTARLVKNVNPAGVHFFQTKRGSDGLVEF